MLLPISHSYAKDYRRCPRLAYYAHDQRYKRVGIDDQRQDGHTVHGALEAYYRAKQHRHNDPSSAALDWLSVQDEQPYRLAFVSALIAGYCARYDSEELKVLRVEEEFQAEFDGIIEQGRIDAIVRYNGQTYVLEHKTTSEDIGPGATYWARLQLDPQCSMYLQGARHLGYEPAGVIYNVIRKPALRPLKATPVDQRRYLKRGERAGELYANQRAEDETPEEYYQRLLKELGSPDKVYYKREVIRRTAQQERDARETLMQTASMIRHSKSSNAWPQNSEACGFYGRPCDYLPVCLGQASLENAALYYKKVG